MWSYIYKFWLVHTCFCHRSHNKPDITCLRNSCQRRQNKGNKLRGGGGGGPNWLINTRLVCGVGDMKSQCKSYEGKKTPKNGKDLVAEWCMEGYLKTWDWWNSQSFQGIASWTPQGGAYYSIPYEPPVAMSNMLTHVELWPRAIKLNPSWKVEFSKSGWIKPCYCHCKVVNCTKNVKQFSFFLKENLIHPYYVFLHYIHIISISYSSTAYYYQNKFCLYPKLHCKMQKNGVQFLLRVLVCSRLRALLCSA